MLMGVAAMSASGAGMVLVLSGRVSLRQHGRVPRRAGGRHGRRQSIGCDAYRGLAQRSPVLALSLLVFLLSLGGIPFVAGFWAKLFIFQAVDRPAHVLARAARRGARRSSRSTTTWCSRSRMYIDAPVDARSCRRWPCPVFVAILFCAVGVVVMGVYPEPWVKAALQATRRATRSEPSARVGVQGEASEARASIGERASGAAASSAKLASERPVGKSEGRSPRIKEEDPRPTGSRVGRARVLTAASGSRRPRLPTWEAAGSCSDRHPAIHRAGRETRRSAGDGPVASEVLT